MVSYYPYSVVAKHFAHKYAVPPKLVFHGKLAELRFEENGNVPTAEALAGSPPASVAGTSKEGVPGPGTGTPVGMPVAAQKQKQPAGVHATAGVAAPWQGVAAPQAGTNSAMVPPQAGTEDTIMGGTDETVAFGVHDQAQATAVRG